MERERVIAVLESLANGMDPGTGTQIPSDAFHSADAVRALFTAAALLKSSDTAPAKRRTQSAALPAAGAPWSTDEDAKLCREFDAGMTAAQIALQHGRTSGAITSRLVKLGRLDPSTVTSRDRGARVIASRGATSAEPSTRT